MISGGLVFMYLESSAAKDALSPHMEILKLEKSIAIRLNVTVASIHVMFEDLYSSLGDSAVAEPYKWDYYESCFFVLSLLTTIGM